MIINERVGVVRLPNRVENPRKNFKDVGGNDAESSFLYAFERAYFCRKTASGVASGEFAMSGFGIADLVWISWSPELEADDFTALSLERKLKRRQLFAFEGKIKNWSGALQQAFRYRYFADKAIVVMPQEHAAPAIRNLDAFRHVCVGFWAFDVDSGTIRQHYTPTRTKAFSPDTKLKAIRMLASKVDFSQFGEQLDAGAK